MALDRQKILTELNNVVSQLQSADCGCVENIFGNSRGNPSYGQSQGWSGFPSGCGQMAAPHHTVRPATATPLVNPHAQSHTQHHALHSPIANNTNPAHLFNTAYRDFQTHVLQPTMHQLYREIKEEALSNAMEKTPGGGGGGGSSSKLPPGVLSPANQIKKQMNLLHKIPGYNQGLEQPVEAQKAAAPNNNNYANSMQTYQANNLNQPQMNYGMDMVQQQQQPQQLQQQQSQIQQPPLYQQQPPLYQQPPQLQQILPPDHREILNAPIPMQAIAPTQGHGNQHGSQAHQDMHRSNNIHSIMDPNASAPHINDGMQSLAGQYATNTMGHPVDLIPVKPNDPISQQNKTVAYNETRHQRPGQKHYKPMEARDEVQRRTPAPWQFRYDTNQRNLNLYSNLENGHIMGHGHNYSSPSIPTGAGPTEGATHVASTGRIEMAAPNSTQAGGDLPPLVPVAQVGGDASAAAQSAVPMSDGIPATDGPEPVYMPQIRPTKGKHNGLQGLIYPVAGGNSPGSPSWSFGGPQLVYAAARHSYRRR